MVSGWTSTFSPARARPTGSAGCRLLSAESRSGFRLRAVSPDRRNDAGYRYGEVSLLNLAYEHKVSARWDAVLEANYRHAGLDEVATSHATDPDTGGSMLYVTPRVLFDAGRGWVVRVSGQIPVSQPGLNGEQREKTVFNLGFTRLFR